MACSTANGRDEEAVTAFEMISRQEARIRVYVGFVLWALAAMTCVAYGVDLLPAGAWVTWAAAGVVIHRMGIESQCGCIFKGKVGDA
jgi:hypothetical protein